MPLPFGVMGRGFGRMGAARTKGGGFSTLAAFMAAQSDGLWLDFTKTDRHFQDASLTTLGDDAGEAIGYALDGRKWRGLSYSAFLAAQPELVTNGNFDTDLTGWNSVNTGGVASGQGTLSLVSNRLRNTASGASLSRYATQRLTGLTVGDSLLMKGVFNRQTQAWTSAQLRTAISSGTQITSLATNFAAGDVSFAYLSDPAAQSAYNLNLIGAADTAALYADFDQISVKAIPGQHARQATAGSRPLRQTAGAKFDGTDDNLLSTYLAAAGANFLQVRTTVPASLAATQIIAGAEAAASANRFQIGINTSGFACAGLGADAMTTIVGNTDLRGTEADIALTCDGNTARLLVNGAVQYQAAQNGLPTTAIPPRVGANNANGTAGSFYAGYVKHLLSGREFLSLALFNQIRAALP